MKRILTGIKPTGYAHLGNYFGAIKPAIELSESDDVECFYFIADYHALTSVTKKEDMQNYFFNIACTWLACGLNPDKVVFYKQSDVPEIFELTTILNNLTPKGLMNRAHAYKAAVDKNMQNGMDVDSGINMGLYNYPILMSADILMFDTNLVPVGLDQKQHVEIARDIANSFNQRYGKCLVEPDVYLQKGGGTLLGLDGRKMSKSYGNIIDLFCSESELKKKINKIITDSSLPNEPKSLDCTINQIYKIFASKDKQKKFESKLQNGISWGDAKKELFELVNDYLTPLRDKFNYYMQNKELVLSILEKGALKARDIAKKKLNDVKKHIGVIS